MTDPYLQALDDVAGELGRLQRRGPDFPAFHGGPILEQLGELAGAIEELRRRRQAPAQDPGPVPRCGDHVLHRPTGETWVVAFADPEEDVLAWAGWPEGRAHLSDCDLVQRCSDEEHRHAVARWAASSGTGFRRARVLALYGDPAPADPIAADRAEWDAAPRW